jgi:4-amino-4-deoxy-L-arabinose transferase-like glycosyltransferase
MYRTAALIILLAALVIRVAWVLETPNYELVHDAIDYDNHAYSIAVGEWYALSHGRSTAFRPPLYPLFLGGVYWLTGVELEPDRIEVARMANAVVGTGIVALIGLLALQLWGRRVALVAMALAAVYIPLITVGQSVMSEPLATLFLLGAIAAALRRWALLAGVLAGLAILGRPNALILLAPLAVAVWRGPKPAIVLVVAAALTVVPWTIRNAIVLDHFVPVSTQLGSALAGTYNSDARGDRENPASWRSIKRVSDYEHLYRQIRTTNEAELESELRATSLEFIREHPGYVFEVAFWTSRRMLDLAGTDWSIHTASTISAGRRAAIWGVVCFWVFAVLAVIGAFTRRARAAPLWFWSLPVLMWLSVMFLVVETPRYRTAIDPFIVLLAALAIASVWKNRPERSDGPAPDPDRRVPHGGHAAAG